MHSRGRVAGQDLTVLQTESPSLQMQERQEVAAGSSEKRCPETYVLFWNRHLPERK